jgi:hypothetical protein
MQGIYFDKVKRKYLNKAPSLFIPILISVFGMAQTTSNQMWYTYNHQAIVSNKWGYMFDLNHRTTNFKNTRSVLSAVRIGATFLYDKDHRFSAGYAWFGTHFQEAQKELLTEHRLWQQYQVFGKRQKGAFFHRIRVEQRWRELMPSLGSSKGETAFSVRGRYMYQHQGPIVPLTNKNKLGVWWQGASEIMLHAGDGIEKHYFDQLRIIGGIVLLPSKNLNLAVLYQYINQYRPAISSHVNIHSIRLTLLHQFDWSGQRNQNGTSPIQKN